MDVKSMTTEDLKQVLQKDSNSDNSEMSIDEICSVAAELALREGKSSEDDAKEAWQRFLMHWAPGEQDLLVIDPMDLSTGTELQKD